MTTIEFVNKIKEAGWKFLREGSKHSIYFKDKKTFSVPRKDKIKKGIIWQWERLNKQVDEERKSKSESAEGSVCNKDS